MTTCVTEGVRQERHKRGAGEGVAAALVSRISQLRCLKFIHKSTPLTKSKEKETPCIVLACLQICFVPARKNFHLAI